jgi:hypothetical protein
VPVYLFKRARALGQPLAYFWTWIAMFVLSLAIGTDLKSFFSGDVYLGVGIPPCQGSYTDRHIKDIFAQIEFVRFRGIKAVDIRNQAEIGMANNVRTCVAVILGSDTRSYTATYTIEERGSQFFIQLQVQQQ